MLELEGELARQRRELGAEMVVVEDELAPIEEVIAEEEARPSGLEEPPALKRRRTEDDPDAEWMEQMGKFSQQFSDRMSEIGFERLVAEVRGKPDISPEVGSIPHPAAVLLEELRTVGARVEISTEPLTAKQLDAAAEYGSHGSCVRGLGFICREMLDFIEKGFYMVLPFDQVRDLEGLRLAPMGLVPQRDRRDRIVVDYSFYGLNDATVSTAPDSMQYGRALQRVLQQIYDADPKHGAVHMIKVDVSDGFYRVGLKPSDIPKLAIAMPPVPGCPPLVVFPLVLPMGWTQSPPYFCALTETVADLANDALKTSDYGTQPHRLDELADTEPPPTASRPATLHVDHNRRGYNRRPLAYIDVFVDDFLGLAQGDRARRNRVRRSLLHSFDLVFRPLEQGEEPRQEPVSVKKLLKGDSCWATTKVLLGWLVDSVRGTIELPPHRAERLIELITSFQSRTRCSLKAWRQLIGELRSMTVALPGSEGLFSHMQEALVRALKNGRVHLTRHNQAELADWLWLAKSLQDRPTSIAEVVRKPAAIGGDCDAAKAGMGGVLFDLRRDRRPILWRAPFPSDIQQRLVSWDNPTGDITNSDLELAGVLAQHDVAAQCFDVRHTTVATRNDNSSAVSWSLRGSVSRDGIVAYLLRLFSLHRRAFRYSTSIEHLAGDLNRMADDCSRLWNLTDKQLIDYFNTTYPQERSWKLCQLRPEMNSALISALRRQRSSPEWLPSAPTPTDGSGEKSGSPSASPSATTRTSLASPTRYPSFKYSSAASETAASPWKNTRYVHVLQKPISGRLGRRAPDWARKMSASTPPATSTSVSSGN